MNTGNCKHTEMNTGNYKHTELSPFCVDSLNVLKWTQVIVNILKWAQVTVYTLKWTTLLQTKREEWTILKHHSYTVRKRTQQSTKITTHIRTHTHTHTHTHTTKDNKRPTTTKRKKIVLLSRGFLKNILLSKPSSLVHLYKLDKNKCLWRKWPQKTNQYINNFAV